MTNSQYSKLSRHSKQQNVWRQRATDKAFRILKRKYQRDWMTLYHRIETEFRTMHYLELADLRDMFLDDLRADGIMRDGRSMGNGRKPDGARRFPCPSCGAKQWEVCRAKSGAYTRIHAARRARDVVQNPTPEGVKDSGPSAEQMEREREHRSNLRR